MNSCPRCRSDNPADTAYCGKCGTKLPEIQRSGPDSPEPGIAPPGSMTETIQTPREELTTGSTFAGRYQIIEELGRGGMGKVYKALDKEINAKIALKLIKPEIAADRDTIERFRNELRTARDISHKNICRMYDLGREAGNYYITMEYVSGEDLKDMIRMSGQLGVGTAVSIARQIAEGLSAAHGRGVVHRDLKPANIMIDRNGVVRIMDFGIARSTKGKGLTGVGVMIGTPEYMSPEQVEGKDVDHRSDIYSLGIILYEMLTGRVPFEGDTPFTVGVKHKSERPEEPNKLNAQIPDDLNRLVLRCLEKDRSRRYQSAQELGADLDMISKGMPTTPGIFPKHKTLTSREITVKFTPRKLLLPAAAVAALVIGAVVFLVILPRKAGVPAPSGKPSLAVVYFENISADPALDDWKTGLPELITTDLSQSRFVNVISGDSVFGALKKLNLIEAKKYSAEDLAKVSSATGAQYILSGSLLQAGPKIILTARLQKPRGGEVVEMKKIECAGEADIPSKVDELTRMIKADLNLTPSQIKGDIDKEVGKITTTAPEALKYYVEARKRHMSMEYREAIPLYEKAVALDPGFAMAYRGLGTCYSNLSYLQKGREFNQKALANADRISDRERLLIEGRDYYLYERTYEKAIQTFEQLLKLYPDDYIGNNGLGVVYSALEEDEKALPCMERSYALHKDALGCVNVGGLYNSMGQYEKTRAVWEDFLKSVSDSPRIHAELGRTFLDQGRYDEAMAEADKAFLLSPGSLDGSYLKSDIFYFQDHFEAAEKECRAVLERGPRASTLFARIRLIGLEVAQGRFKDAAGELDRLIAVIDELGIANLKATTLGFAAGLDGIAGHPDQALQKIETALKISRDLDFWPRIRGLLAQKGVMNLKMGSMDDALKAARELKEFIAQGLNKKAARYADFLDGNIELKRGNSSKAVELLEKAVVYLPHQSAITDEHANFLDSLATAYEGSGNMAKARETYEKITGLTMGRFFFGANYAISYYKLGKIAEKQGEKRRAVENYRRFLDLMKNADSGISAVEEAKNRIADLSR